jgi:hypothetical protein
MLKYIMLDVISLFTVLIFSNKNQLLFISNKTYPEDRLLPISSDGTFQVGLNPISHKKTSQLTLSYI